MSEAEQVADLHKKLTAVVEKTAGGVGDVAGRRRRRLNDVEVLQIAVVADINRRAGMHEVGNQEVGVELLGGGQVGVGRSNSGIGGEQPVVLEDDAHGELRSELPVPLAANDVIVKDAVSASGELRLHKRICAVVGTQALEQVGIFDLQRLNGPKGERGLSRVLSSDVRVAVGARCSWFRDEVYPATPGITREESGLLEISTLK